MRQLLCAAAVEAALPPFSLERLQGWRTHVVDGAAHVDELLALVDPAAELVLLLGGPELELAATELRFHCRASVVHRDEEQPLLLVEALAAVDADPDALLGLYSPGPAGTR